MPVQYPQTVDLSTVYRYENNQTYTYYYDKEAAKPVADYKNVGISGTYYVMATNGVDCTIISSVNVQINPPPPYIISGPNVFTPNNDGINDYFMVKIDGFVKFGNLKIFNRYGQLLFTAKTENVFGMGVMTDILYLSEPIIGYLRALMSIITPGLLKDHQFQ